jgi:putative PIN family toxin of toxin-antitoxin system
VKVALDTMIWVSYCTLKDGFRHRLLERARRQRVRFFVSEYILDELVDVLVEDLGRTRRYASLARRAVLRIAKLVPLPPSPGRFVPGDPGDDPVVQTALAAKADYLVTADKEILKLVKVQNVEILTAAQFANRLAPVE